MREKISLEEFRRRKQGFIDLINELSAKLESKEASEEELNQILVERYFAMQDELLSYDLSDIPAEEWNNYTFVATEDKKVDLAPTKANIDFRYITVNGNISFKGCKVSHLEAAGSTIRPEDFDEETIASNPQIFLTGDFSEDFKDKYYRFQLTMDDIASLSKEQLEEFKQKEFQRHIKYTSRLYDLIKTFDLSKVVELYNYSKDEYTFINELFQNQFIFGYLFQEEHPFNGLIDNLKKANVEDMKGIAFQYLRDWMVAPATEIELDNVPKLFLEENKKLFLVDADVPYEVRARYFKKQLTIDDLTTYKEVFSGIPFEHFLFEGKEFAQKLEEKYGSGTFLELVNKYPEAFNHLNEAMYGIDMLINYIDFEADVDLDTLFIRGVKEFVANREKDTLNARYEGPDVVYDAPEWLSSIGITIKDRITTKQELLEYDEKVLILNHGQRKTINMLGIDNIRKFDEETEFFTRRTPASYGDIEGFDLIVTYVDRYNKQQELYDRVDFKGGCLPYEEFKDQMALLFDCMKFDRCFNYHNNYSYITGDFREKHPELFISEDAPEGIKNDFYVNNLDLVTLHNSPEYIPYLLDKNLASIIRGSFRVILPTYDLNGDPIYSEKNLIDEYSKRHGNQATLELIVKYGFNLHNITLDKNHNNIDDKELCDKEIRRAIYEKMIREKTNYEDLSKVPEFVQDFPELFVDLKALKTISGEDKATLIGKIYNRELSFKDIKDHPELIDVLKDKNLYVFFAKCNKMHSYHEPITDISEFNAQKQDLALLYLLGNEKFLDLCSKYGNYLFDIAPILTYEYEVAGGKLTKDGKEISYEEITSRIEDIITQRCFKGEVRYYPEDAPLFLKEKHPELFLAEDAPEELKKYFYDYYNNYPMKLRVLKIHKAEWMPYLEGKAIATALLKDNYKREEMQKLFDLFGVEKALKLGLSKCDTVQKMIDESKVDLMKQWYDKTGGKFIPDSVVMLGFPIEEADNFLEAGNIWSTLMRTSTCSITPEGIEAMLKLAYTFGVFEHDPRGIKLTQSLLCDIPRHLPKECAADIHDLDFTFESCVQTGKWFKTEPRFDGKSKMYNYSESPLSKEEKQKAFENMLLDVSNNPPVTGVFNSDNIVQFIKAVKQECPDIDFSKPIFKQIFRENEDGSFTLMVDAQRQPKTSKYIREFIEEFDYEIPMINATSAHKLFGAFNLEYNPHFREFLLANLETFLTDSDKGQFLGPIQRQFDEIRKTNINRHLTVDLAISYVQENKYAGINPGNERAAAVSAFTGYSQKDFVTLQKIYNYGKQRVFSSIPRIEGKHDKYSYEMLKLDDPLAMAIGTQSDCCQELGNCAEMCMEHSMTSEHGRIFVVRDENGLIVAQSWVWRNKGILCFDNIEIPDKAFERYERENPGIGKHGLAKEVFDVYKQAAHELMEVDEEKYKELLDKGLITQEEYDGLRLSKVTSGLGYNDIKDALEANSERVSDKNEYPLPYEPPVKLDRSLYTSDSRQQVILDKREDAKEYDGPTPTVYEDEYEELTDETFGLRELLTMEKLEILTKNNPNYLDTSIDEDRNKGQLVTALARSYRLNPSTTKVIMHPNFAIIYDVNGDDVKIGDLLFNTKVDNEDQQLDIEDKVKLQIKLALDQIGKGKNINVSNLEEKQLEMYVKATGITEEELDKERGVGHAR